MDFKTLLRAIFGVVAAIAMILGVVFVVNEGRFARLLAGGRGPETAEVEREPGERENSTVRKGTYGTQIGDNLKGFLSEDGFFDEEVPVEEVLIEEAGGEPPPEEAETTEEGAFAGEGSEEVLHFDAELVEGDILVHVLDSSGNLVTGKEFMIQMNGLHLYRDDDMDGIIRLEDLPSGQYRLKLQEYQGYQVPAEEVSIRVS